MESKKFKIALFMLPLLTQGGGAENYFIDLARNFSEKGYQTDIITMDEKFFRRFARLLHIFVLGNFFGKIETVGRENEGEILKRLGKARWLKTSFRNLRNTLQNYDIIYSKNELVELVLLKLSGFEKLPPVVVGVHTPLFYFKMKSFFSRLHNFLYLSFIYKWLLRDAKCIHVSNKFTRGIVESNFNAKSWLIYYPFSIEEFAKLAKENVSDTDFKTSKRNIIFVGRVGEQKGIDILINLIKKISQDIRLKDGVRVNIFGSGDKEYESEIKSLAKKFSFVKYFGYMENKFIPSILMKQDLMIAPFRWETLPYSILEAQSLGLPVIAFDIPGPSDIIINGKTGFLVSSEKEFFEKVKDVVEGKVNFDREIIIQNVKEKFNPEKVYPRLIEMFQSVLCEN